MSKFPFSTHDNLVPIPTRGGEYAAYVFYCTGDEFLGFIVDERGIKTLKSWWLDGRYRKNKEHNYDLMPLVREANVWALWDSSLSKDGKHPAIYGNQYNAEQAKRDYGGHITRHVITDGSDE